MWLRLTFAAVVCLATFSAGAQDRVHVRYIPAYPALAGHTDLPDLSSEYVEIKVARVAGFPRKRNLAIDQYFAAIQKILTEQRASSNWERAIVHAPSVQLDIVVSGDKYSLSSSYSSNGLDTFPDEDGANERHRRAMEAILQLTIRQVATKSPVQ
jgi:hypothetical protein